MDDFVIISSMVVYLVVVSGKEEEFSLSKDLYQLLMRAGDAIMKLSPP